MALVVHLETLYFTVDQEHPVGTLIEGIWNHSPHQARAITRNRIFTDQKLTPLCEGMLKVAAKRYSRVEEIDYKRILAEWKTNKNCIEIEAVKPILKPLPFSFETCTVEQVAALSNLKIGAILLDTEKKVVSWGWNDHYPNKTMHAEIMLIKNFISRTGLEKIPAGYTLICSLQPCAMCAGYLYEYSKEFKSLSIHYQKEDLGPFAQNSLLVKGSPLYMKCFG